MAWTRNLLFRLAVLVAFAQPAASAEGLVSTKRLSAPLAAELAMAAVAACAEKDYHVGVVVLDYSGVQQAALRGDGAAPQNVLNANDKAYTAASFGADTADLVARSKNGAVSSAFVKVPHLLLNAGGVVIKVGDEVIGAIGVSGAPGGDNDAACAKTALEKIRDRMK
ncbi:MAG TPA: heme-binding protein [Xanthobacteraceae bacterium]|jgi:uncharacterized protein GlcG (DUF336 family)|nr:heme-binding protein [Xanthobacteraceae bacterium]